ncbi:MAG: hypothetical protein GTO03_03860, partial [Planctomycetales bacterium]|nr:hypothetical protein [Planctomycetales bacterium]
MLAKFPHISPLAKLLVWLGLVAVLAALVQAVAWLAGTDFHILASGKGGRGVLLALALSSLLAMIALDRRPISDFGLFVGPRWKKLWLGGLVIGATTYLVYAGFALALGGYEVSFERITAARAGKGVLAGMTAMPLALVQQILFSGYLLGMLRQRYSRLAAVVIPAFLFAVMGRLHNPLAVLEPSGQPLIIGLFLVATLLGTLRLLTGSILLPAGLLAGWMFVRRVLAKTALVVPASESVWTPWLVPRGDTRQGPLMWLLLSAAIAGCWWALRRRGEAVLPAETTGIDADFKRVFPLFHGSVLAPLDVWIERLVAARFRIGWVYLPRLIVALVLSAANTLLSLPERLLLPWLLRRRTVPDPVFIVGLQRTGTTHLHNLMALDPQFCTTRAYHIFNPVGFLFSGWLLAPLLQAFLPWKRPMDAVRFHLFAPNEEEFVLAGTCGISPYWGMTFPRQWPAYDRLTYIDQLPAADQQRWKRHYLLFLKKLTCFSGKRPLLKSPNNTGRVAVLRGMFPQARFVHLHRDPEVVYLSNVRLAREAHVINQLQDPQPDTSYPARFLENYAAMET